MKTHRIWKWMLVTGKPEELESVDKLASGTHFLTAYGNKRGGPRKVKEIAPLPKELVERDARISEAMKQEASMSDRKCKWYDENGNCSNPESRGENEMCDIEPEHCIEAGFEWEASHVSD